MNRLPTTAICTRLILLAVVVAASTAARAATHVVNSSADTTDSVCDVASCTLREAIDAANAGGGGTIHFAIGSGAATITLTSVLPDLTTPIIIDGTTQPGYAGTPLIQITGSSTASSCLVVRSSDTTIRALDIGTCLDGIAVLSTTGTAISNIALERNFIGTRLATASINRNAIRLEATGTSTLSGVTIGDATPAGRNLLATFGFVQDALFISGNTSDVTVAGNYIGVNDSGTALQTVSRFTTDIGIYGSAGSSNLLIGGSTAGERNVMADGGGTQVHIKIDSLGSGLTIEGNYIGTDPTGMTRMGASNFGIWFFAEGSATIRNNVIATDGGNAVSRGVATTGPVIVQGNYIGVNASGTAAFATVPASAFNDFSSAPGYVIGGPSPGDGNVIAGYHTAVFVESPSALVQGNLIGLDAAGTNILGSGTRGIATSFARIEPGVFFSGNKIAGFTTGIEVGNEAKATVENNFIGTDATGTLARPNTTGIAVNGAAGRTTIAGNVIAGNSSHGILINTTTMPVDITGNRIGVNAADTPLPNGGDGIRVTNGTAAKHIGFLAGAANTIAHNGGVGVNVAGGNSTSILGNAIFDNGGLAIDLGTAGSTPNDAVDADTGANGLQNAPALVAASNGAGGTTVEGLLHSTPGTAFTIELYANTAVDPSLHGEAETFLTRFNVATDAAGDAPFSTLIPPVAPGTIISASATDTVTLETSEMSNDVTVVSGGILEFSAAAASIGESAGSITITVTRTGGSVPATVDYTSANGTATAGSDYTAVAGTLNLGAADTSQTFNVPITTDALDEPDETFTLTLSNVTGGALGSTVMETVTITDDDAMPTLTAFDASVTEGNSGTSILSFDVQLTAASGQTITVDYSTADQTASAGPDYGTRFGTLTFAPGETTKTVDVIVNGDTTAEADETLQLLLTGTSNASFADGEGIGTIVNDDGAPVISIGDVTVVEGDSGTSTATLTLTLSNPSSTTVSVDWATNASSASAGSDFTTASGVVTFNPGITSQTIDVDILGDTIDEALEQLEVNLTNPSGGTIGDAQGLVTIADDDGEPSLTISNVAVAESAGTATLTVLLAPASAQTVTVVYDLADATATAGSDYTDGSATLTFDPGVTTQTFAVPIANDNFDEGTETFDVTLSAPSIASIANGNATVTIIDDDGTPNASIDDINVVEGDGGIVNAAFTVTLTNPSASTITMNWSTNAGTATSGSDFTGASGTLTFLPGDTSEPVVIDIQVDVLDEPDETFFVNLGGAANANITKPQGTGTIINDDGTPTLIIADASLTEGDAGSSMASFVVTLAGSTAQVVTVDYTVADGTALANSDYAPIAGQLTFAPGVTTQTIDVPVIGDLDVESAETFFVNLSSAVNASVSDGQALGTIDNDDTAPAVPSISIADTTATEGNAGTTAATFTVTLSPATTTTVTVDYATANGTANAGSDYASASGTLVFAPGVTSRTISVAVASDTLVEGNETFVVDLANATNGTIVDAQATGTILDDDVAAVVPAISITDATVTEGDSGTTNATFSVTLNATTTNSVTVDYATANGTAIAGSDFASASGTLVFAPGVLAQSIIVAVAGDTAVEAHETFTVNLSNPSSATIAGAQALGTITNDDSASVVPEISISGDTVTEGDVGTTTARFNVTLDAASTTVVTVDYDTSSNTADGGADYVSTSGTLVFAPGVRSQSITVAVLGDTLVEGTETFRVRLRNASGATIARSQATGTIVDDDVPVTLPSLSIAPATVLEGDSGATAMSFVVTLSHGATSPVTVGYATADDTAQAGSDYLAATGTLAFAPGETSRTIVISVNGDLIAEGDEAFTVVLSAPTGATLAAAEATGTIQDDDTSSVRAVFVIVGSGPGNSGAFFRTQLQLHNRSDQAISGDLVFHPMGGGEARRFGYSLEPRETRNVGDILENGFGTIDVAPLVGALPVGTMRVYNDGAAHGQPGFLSAMIGIEDAIRAGGRGLLIAPANAAAMRYNIGMRALASGASLTFTLRRADGTIAATATRTLGPNTLIQLSANSLFETPLHDNDSIDINVTTGAAIVYGSAVENTSQDPSLIIATP